MGNFKLSALVFLVVEVISIHLEFCEAYSYQVQRVIQRMDDMEKKLLTEAAHRREDIQYVHLAINSLEERLNVTLGIFEANGGISQEFELPGDYTLNNNTKNLYHSVKVLEKAFKSEKLLNSRVRRHITDIDGVLKTLEDKMIEASDNIKTGLATLNELSGENNVIDAELRKISQKCGKFPDVLKDVSEMKEILINSRYDSTHPKSCLELFKTGQTKSGIYEIYPPFTNIPIKVYCDQKTAGGGWTVFQRRQDGSVNFNRGWYDYETGFGDLESEFWLGNENIHRALFAKCCYELRIELKDFANNNRYARYNNFMVGPKSGSYMLTAAGYSGDAGDSLSYHNGHSFSAKDHGKSASCAQRYTGGWWYGDCHYSNLNGLYLRGQHSSSADGVEWYHWTGYHYSLKFTEMKFREHSED